MFGNTDSTTSPSYGKAFIVNEFSQFFSDIYTKKMTNKETIANTIANTPMIDKYLSFYIFSIMTAGTNSKDTTTIMNHSDK